MSDGINSSTLREFAKGFIQCKTFLKGHQGKPIENLDCILLEFVLIHWDGLGMSE